MTTTAHEEGRNLVVDLGGAGTFTVPPMPGKHGKEALGILLGIATGSTSQEHGPARVTTETERLANMCLGLDGIRGYSRRTQFRKLRSSQQEILGTAAILWNVHGGSIDAVNDLLEEGGGFPKALGRVMRSSGLGHVFEALQTLLNGASPAPSSAADSSPDTSTPTGTANTSD